MVAECFVVELELFWVEQEPLLEVNHPRIHIHNNTHTRMALPRLPIAVEVFPIQHCQKTKGFGSFGYQAREKILKKSVSGSVQMNLK